MHAAKCSPYSLCRYNILLNCWENIPDDRPLFLEIVSRFSSFLDDIANYFVLSNLAAPKDSECDQETAAGLTHETAHTDT